MQATSHRLTETDPELCLDFTDVVDWRTSDHAKDTCDSYDKLVEWSRGHGILNEKQASALSRLTTKEDSARTLADATRLREAIYRTFSAIAHKRKSDPRDLGVLNEYLARGFSRVRVTAAEGTYHWGWSDQVSPDMMLYPIASSAAGLLTSDDLGKVRECANEEEGCGSLFLDHSKGQNRRWCSMETCGNRMKFRAYYERQHHPKGHAGHAST